MTQRTLQIAPSLLAADFTRLGEQLHECEEGGADLIHFDVMDGRFVPNITMGPFILEAVKRATNLPLDVHLMIVEPERYVQDFANAGADTISIHVEASPHLHRTLQTIAQLGCRVGVALNPHTPASALSEVMHLVDIINVMTVNPGFGGQKFLYETMSKIAKLRAMAGDIQRAIDIEVDGGINSETASSATQSGANVLVGGTAIFRYPNGIAAGVSALRDAAMGNE